MSKLAECLLCQAYETIHLHPKDKDIIAAAYPPKLVARHPTDVKTRLRMITEETEAHNWRAAKPHPETQTPQETCRQCKLTRPASSDSQLLRAHRVDKQLEWTTDNNDIRTYCPADNLIGLI